MKKNNVYLFLVIVLLACCTKEKTDVNVFVNSKFIKENAVTIDDTLTLKDDQCAEFCKTIMKSGAHTISINSKKDKFEIGENGGILNLERSEFVIFPLKYTSGDAVSEASINSDFPIIIGDTIIYEKDMASNQVGLVSLLKNPIAKDIFSYNLEKTNKDQFFINKNWDYGINDEIPDNISVKTTAEEGIIEYKRKVIKAQLFLLHAQISGNYKVEPIESKELKELVSNFEKE